ncbi:hypothetical protein AX15_006211 [Amanita polypyramis BW_CC]|nr:hypothetical protein AX15_006211 [Amanita polypyramis BW_CC]
MSSDCPPQLQLRLPPSTTSFKRSFEEYGFDLATPGDSSQTPGSTTNGNERNKRPRSASSLSDSAGSSGSSHSSSSSAASSSSSTSYGHISQNTAGATARSALSATRTSPSGTAGHDSHAGSSSTRPFHEIPVQPPPAIQDVEMLSYLPTDASNTQSPTSPPPIASPPASQPSEQLRLSLERFTAFEAEISTLRRSSSLSPRTITPPPTLPPLMLSDDQPDLATAALPFLHRTNATHPRPHDIEGSLGGSDRGHGRRVDTASRDGVHSRNPDIRPFQFDLHIDPRLQSASQNSPTQVSPEGSTWAQAQSTPTTNDPAMTGLEFTSIRDRLDSALEPLRTASPLVPELVGPRPTPPAMATRPPRASAPTLPPLRTQLQQSSAWDDWSYRMLLFGPPASTTNNHDREGLMHEDRPPDSSLRLQLPPFWNENPYDLLTPMTTNRDRDPTPQSHTRYPSPLNPGTTDNSLNVHPPASHQPDSSAYEELDMDPIPLVEPPRESLQQQIPSSSSESLSRSPLEGYLSSEDWLPMLRRRSAWRLLDSDEEERLSMDARRLRLFAERRDALRAGRPGGSSSLDSSNHTPPWLEFGERRRSVPARPPPSTLRPNPPSVDRRVPISAPFDGFHFWDDTDSDRMSGHAAESDNWASTENYPRSTRTDLSQRLERPSDDSAHAYESSRPPLMRSNTTTSTFAALNRLRSRLYHNTTTRFGSPNSPVTENSSEFRRRNARQEWMERLSRIDDERAQTQAETRPNSRPILPDTSASDESRRAEFRGSTNNSLERRLFGHIDSLEETRRPSGHDMFSFQTSSMYDDTYLPRRATTHPRSVSTSTSRPWSDHSARRPSSPVQSISNRPTSGILSPAGLGTERYGRMADLNEYFDSSSSMYAPFPSIFNFGPIGVTTRASGEPAVLRNTRDPQNDWFSRRRNLARPSHSSLWSEADGSEFIERPADEGRGAGLGLRTDTTGSAERERDPLPRSSLDRHAHPRVEEPARIPPTRPISPYLIDVPPLPSPDLSDLLENVSDFPQNASHEERLISSRPLPDLPLSSRVIPRRRSPSPPPRSTSTRTRLERTPGRMSVFESIDPELFAPGPYRNTFQSLQRRREPSPQTSQPPTIPPFSFEAGTERELPSARRLHHLYETHEGGRPVSQVRAESESEPPRSQFRRALGRRPAVYVRNDWEYPSPPAVMLPSDVHGHVHGADHHRHRHAPTSATPSSDLHNFLNRHVRLEGSRMERFNEAAQLSEPSSNVSRFNHAIEVLRGEGLSRRQPLDRPAGPRASTDNSRERTSLDWLAAHHHHQHIRPRRMRARRVRPLGDYMRDEDFDESYESLLSLAAAIGDVKPRCTPEEVISKLETAMYKDWATSDCDKRCPICLDDYSLIDPVMKMGDCGHWLHKDCLHQWLKGANTCPVCRMVVHSPRLRNMPRQQRGEGSSSGTNNPNNASNPNDRRDESSAPQSNTNHPSSSNAESPSSPFSTRTTRPFGWPGWRYYHP